MSKYLHVLLFVWLSAPAMAQLQDVTLSLMRFDNSQALNPEVMGGAVPSDTTFEFHCQEVGIESHSGTAIVFYDRVGEKTIHIHVATTDFYPSLHRLDEKKRTIDGLDWWGSDAGWPVTQFRTFSVNIDGVEVPIPSAIRKRLFNPRISVQNVPEFRVYFEPKREVLFCHFGGGDGAGAYNALLVLGKEGVLSVYCNPVQETHDFEPDFSQTDWLSPDREQSGYLFTLDKLDQSLDAKYLPMNPGDREYDEELAVQNLGPFLATSPGWENGIGQSGPINGSHMYFWIELAEPTPEVPRGYTIIGKRYFQGEVYEISGGFYLDRAVLYQKSETSGDQQVVLAMGDFSFHDADRGRAGSGRLMGTLQLFLNLSDDGKLSRFRADLGPTWYGTFRDYATKTSLKCNWGNGSGALLDRPKPFWWK